LTRDMLQCLILFLLFLGKIQSHYLIWFFPILLVFIFLSDADNLIFFYFLLGILPLFSILGSLNLGIYFLDVIPWGFINLFLGHDQYTLAWNGFVIMLILLMIFFQSFSKTREEIDTVNSPITYSLIGFACFFFIVIFFFSMSAYRALIAGEN